MNVSENSNSLSFSWYDYVIVFVVIFVFNIVIGIYFAYYANKQSTISDYLLGGRSMSAIPIAISLVASHTSAFGLLSIPADVYRYGAGYMLGAISTLISTVITIYIYLPAFYNLRTTSVYEYLERRFDYKTRLFASLLSVVSLILYLPVVIYVPCLAFSTATGIGVHLLAIVIGGLCIFYTAVGGLRAVVWTDTIQFTIAMLAIGLIWLLGLRKSGGFLTLWKKAADSGRLNIFDFDTDPTKRDTFWSIVVGLTFYRLSNLSIGQECVQKYLALPTFQQSALSVIYFGIGSYVVTTIIVFLGLLVYAQYSDCDPVLSKKIPNYDQIVTFLVMDIARDVPGLAGLFISGVFSASLSTLSAALNCLAGIVYEDFISRIPNKKFDERKATFIMKLTVVITGLICTLLIFVVEHLGGLFALGLSLSGVTSGSLLGMFTLGILFPSCNAKGAFYGALCGLTALAAIIFPVQFYKSQGLCNYDAKPVSTKGCNFINATIIITTKSVTAVDDIPFIFKISMFYYVLLGTCITILSGLIISIATNESISILTNVTRLKNILKQKVPPISLSVCGHLKINIKCIIIIFIVAIFFTLYQIQIIFKRHML